MHNVQNLAEGPQANPFLRLPAEMRDLPQWCVTPGTATDKAPRTVDGKHASVTDPAPWTDFDTARRVALERGWLIGFMLREGDPFTCIDLDVKDNTPEEDIDRFNSIVATFDSYSERSRSGRGLHVWVRGKIGKGRKRDGVEVYSRERFIICTGDVAHERPVSDRQTMLDNMVSQMPKTEIAERALTGDPFPNFTVADEATRNEGELGRLFRGDWQGRRYPTQSEADLALVKLLLPECDSPRECWETFLLSRLGQRDKAKRNGYARSTVALAIQHAENDAEQVQHGKALAEAMGLTREQAVQKGFVWPVLTHNPSHFRLLSDDDLAGLPKPRWKVKGIIPEAGLGVVYGDSGTYKSFLTLDLLAHISNGQDWFDRTVTAAPAVYVPLEGKGGIPKRVDAWRRAHTHDGHMFTTRMRFIMDPLDLRQQADRNKLVVTLTENGWAGGVLCIDRGNRPFHLIDGGSLPQRLQVHRQHP